MGVWVFLESLEIVVSIFFYPKEIILDSST